MRHGRHVADLVQKQCAAITLLELSNPPPEADVIQNRISVFAPIGTALLGYRRGDIIGWKVPSGRRRIEIIKVTPWKAAEYAETAEAAA